MKNFKVTVTEIKFGSVAFAKIYDSLEEAKKIVDMFNNAKNNNLGIKCGNVLGICCIKEIRIIEILH